MKRLLIPAALMALAFTGVPLRNNLTLVWSYPTNELSTDLTFKLYASADLSVPLTNWQVYSNIVGTNLSALVPVASSRMYYFMTASNIVGEGPPSNVASTPPPPRSGSLSTQ